MFPSSARRGARRRRSFRYSLLPLLLLLPLGVCQAQGVGSTRGLPGGTDGQHTIKGRVFAPTGKPLEKTVKVTLENSIVGNKTTVTDSDSAFSFTYLPAGNYTIIIDAGPEYDTVRESFSIFGTSAAGNYAASQTINVPITLRPKGSGAASKSAPPALAGVPKEAADLFGKASEASAKGDHKKAVEHLNAALAIHPKFALALNELGVEYLKLGQPDKAAEALLSAVKLTPDDALPHLNLGIALLNQKKFADAELQLRSALTIDRSLPTAHMYLGVALLSLSRDEKTKQFDAAKYEEAQKELEVAVSTGKDEVAMAHRYLGGIYAGNRDYKRGADELETYLRLVPKAPDAERLKAAIKDLRSKQQ